MEHEHDISIGQNVWIKWVDVDYNDPFEIDFLLEPMKVFWQYLEIDCVAGCCGIDAFVFWPDHIKFAAGLFNNLELKKYLLSLKNAVENSSSKSVSSKRLNGSFDKEVFIKLMDHILSCI